MVNNYLIYHKETKLSRILKTSLTILSATLSPSIFATTHSIEMSDIQSIPDDYFGAGNSVDIKVKDFGELGSKDSHLNISGDGYVTYEPSSYSDDNPYKGVLEHTNIGFVGGTFNYSQFDNAYITVTESSVTSGGTTVTYPTYLNNSTITDSLLYIQSGDGVRDTTVKGNSQVVVSNKFFTWGGTQYIYPNNPSIKNTIYFDSSSELLEAGKDKYGYSATSFDSTFHDASSQRVMVNGISERSSFYDTSNQLVEAGGYAKDLSLYDQSSSFASAGSIIQGTTSVNNDASFTLELKADVNSAADKVSLNDKNSRFIIYTSDQVNSNEAFINELYNAGTVVFASKNNNAFSTLIVDGNYISDNGSLIMNGILNGDDSVTDKLIINGDTSGTTSVTVNNLGGKGDKTINGIELIKINGQSDGLFEKKGRIVAGAYDYNLIQKDKNWYLTSQISPVAPPVDPTEPPTPPDNEHINRPEGGAYSANMAAASVLFDNRLSDRQGTIYTNPVTGEKHYTSLWLHQTGGHTRSRDQSGQLRTINNRYVAMLGGDIGSGSNGTDLWRIGVLAGYGYSHSNTVSKITGYHAKGDVNGYTAGVYGTWYAEGTDDKGFYVDTLLQYSWFDNTVQGDDISDEKYHSKGTSASFETGYVFPVSQGIRSGFYLQPQARILWSGISANDHIERNGTRIASDSDNNLRSMLGIKAFMKGHASQDDNTDRSFKPFIEANWIHNTQNYGVSMDNIDITQTGTSNIAEAKIGLDANLNQQLRISGNVSQQVGNHGWSDTSASVDIKYSF